MSRRDVFRLAARQGQTALARAMENGVSHSGRTPGRDRLRMLSAAAHLPTPSMTPAPRVDLGELGFAALEVTEACTACGVCARACPTLALKFEKDQQAMTFTLSFSARECIDCGICDRVCLPDAIRFKGAPSMEQVFRTQSPTVATSGELTRCADCRNLMAKREGVQYCQLCEYRRTHPFGSIMPKQIHRDRRA